MCDKCGLEDPECHCYLHELEERIDNLEDELDRLTYIVNQISNHIRREKDE